MLINLRTVFLCVLLSVSCKFKSKSESKAIFEQKPGGNANFETYIMMIQHSAFQNQNLAMSTVGPLVCIYYSQRTFAATQQASQKTDDDVVIFDRHLRTLKRLEFPYRQNLPQNPHEKDKNGNVMSLSDVYADVIINPKKNDTVSPMMWTDLNAIQNYIQARLGVKAQNASGKRITQTPQYTPGLTGAVFSKVQGVWNDMTKGQSFSNALDLQYVYAKINNCLGVEKTASHTAETLGTINVDQNKASLPTNVFKEPWLDVLREALIYNQATNASADLAARYPLDQFKGIQGTLCPDPLTQDFLNILRAHYPQKCPLDPIQKNQMDAEERMKAKNNPGKVLMNILKMKVF